MTHKVKDLLLLKAHGILRGMTDELCPGRVAHSSPLLA